MSKTLYTSWFAGILIINVSVVYMARDVALSGPLKRLYFQGPSAINRNIGNFLVHSFHSMPFLAQKSLDFQVPPLPMPLPIPPPPGRSEFTFSR
jgi:hypothetical protein